MTHRTMQVTASQSYNVEIGPGLLDRLGKFAAACAQGRQAALVSDDTVFGLYGQDAASSLREAGFSVCAYVFPQGEQSKNGERFLDLLGFFAKNHVTRSDLVVALGGGVAGDLTGFAAACYLRGVAYMQVPTTLLAMVDSSVGGKTAIDLPEGKNLAGAFYQPRCVLCDTKTLSTLPEHVVRDGCAEVIKYGVLGSLRLFAQLKETQLSCQPEAVIAACVEMKRDIVAQDEFDSGTRQLLNLGHTFGHAVEASSGYALSHGRSVAIGLAMIARAAARLGYCTPETRDAIVALLEQYGLPTATKLSADVLLDNALGDKKRRDHTITLVVPEEIGHCRLLKIPVEELKIWLRAGM